MIPVLLTVSVVQEAVITGLSDGVGRAWPGHDALVVRQVKPVTPKQFGQLDMAMRLVGYAGREAGGGLDWYDAPFRRTPRKGEGSGAGCGGGGCGG